MVWGDTEPIGLFCLHRTVGGAECGAHCGMNDKWNRNTWPGYINCKRYSLWEMLVRLTVGHTRHSPILKVMVVEASLLGRRTGSRVNSHTLLTKAVRSVTKDSMPQRMPSQESALLLRAWHITDTRTRTSLWVCVYCSVRPRVKCSYWAHTLAIISSLVLIIYTSVHCTFYSISAPYILISPLGS
jgi:hypothetical protein